MPPACVQCFTTEDAEVTARPPAGTKNMFNHEEHEGHEEGCRHIPVWPKAKSLHGLHALHGE